MRRERNGDTGEYSYFDDEIEGGGLMDTIIDVRAHVLGKLTGETAKTPAKETGKRVATKSSEKGTEKVGSKIGEMAGDKIINALTKKKGGFYGGRYDDLRYKFRRIFHLT